MEFLLALLLICDIFFKTEVFFYKNLRAELWEYVETCDRKYGRWTRWRKLEFLVEFVKVWDWKHKDSRTYQSSIMAILFSFLIRPVNFFRIFFAFFVLFFDNVAFTRLSLNKLNQVNEYFINDKNERFIRLATLVKIIEYKSSWSKCKCASRSIQYFLHVTKIKACIKITSQRSMENTYIVTGNFPSIFTLTR